jgi:hypothetical protein
MSFLKGLLGSRTRGEADAKTIPPNEVTVLSVSDAERNGKLFTWRGGLYRGIFQRNAPLYRRLIESGRLEQLSKKGLLVPARWTELQLHPFEFVLEHERMPFVTYPFEWCPAMLRESALCIVDLVSELTREGLELQDGHCWNVLFDGTRPRFVDLGSIVENTHGGVWAAWPEFCRYNLYPLAVASAGLGETARRLLRDFRSAVTGEVAERLCPDLEGHCTHRQHAGRTDLEGRLRFLGCLRTDIESLQLPQATTEWSEYYGESFPGLDPNPDWRPKLQTFWNVLSRLKPKTLLDIASNRGLYAQIAAKQGTKAVAFDLDGGAVSQMYNDACAATLPLIPLVMDIMDPSPALGLGNRWYPNASDRLRADMALAGALVHHMVFKMHLNFVQICDVLASFTRQWLLVEFIPAEDRYVREWWNERDHGWYTLGNFVLELRKHFSGIEILPSDPKPRVFLLCHV